MNFQNIPRDDKVVKRAVRSKLGVLDFFDYKAIEPRLCAYFAAKVGYSEMAELLRAGVDPYTAVARLVTGKQEVTADERQHWKVTYLSLMYGGGIRTIQEQFGVDRTEARKIIRTFHDNLPAVNELSQRVQRAHQRRGYIIGLDGRRLHAEEFGEHKLLNKLIQGSAAGLMKQAIIRVHHWGREHPEVRSHMVLTIHDEIVMDGPESEIDLLHEQIPGLMDRPDISELVPILVDHEVSTATWADKMEYEEWKESSGAGNHLAQV